MKQVRLIHNPTKIGVLTGRSKNNNGRTYLQVLFPTGFEWKPDDQLEEAPMNEAPIDLLLHNKFGTPTDLRRILVHTKVSGKLADILYSMETTNTDFYSYQFKPVLKILDSPSNGLLIADEVGLGKTIEAGLIWTELRMRHNLKTLVIVCPAALREKWEIELSKRFGVDARICNAEEALRMLEDPTRRRRGFAIITSMQGLRPGKNYENENVKSNRARLARYIESKQNEEPIIDLLIVDEAHHMRNRNTQTRKIGYLLGEVSEFKIFLSATPIHNRNEDLFSLLQLLDPNTFTDLYSFDRILKANGPLIQARDLVLRDQLDRSKLLEILREGQDHNILASSHQLKNIISSIQIEDEISSPKTRSVLASKLEKVNLLSNIVTRTRKRDVTEWSVIRKPIPEFVPMTEYEREYYDFITSVVIDYAETCDVNERFLLAQPQRQITSSLPASLIRWKGRYEKDEENNDSALGPLVTTIIDRINSRDTRFELERLIKEDSKYNRLREVILKLLKADSKEKIILFSTFRSTLTYLEERLEKDGIRSILMMGGQVQSKEEIIRRFEDKGGPSVLLSSEVGSEGVDMQFSRVVINYDLPWNPMKVEQRIGRVDRLGQKANKVIIWNMLYDQTIDARIYKKLYDKLDLCRTALGDFEAVLGEEIRKLEIDLFSEKLSPKQEEERINQTAIALEALRQTELELEEQASNLVAFRDFVLHQIHTVRDLQRWITPGDLRQYLSDFLTVNYSGSRIESTGNSNDTFYLNLSNDAKTQLINFVRENHLSGIDLFHSQSRIICKFENKVHTTKKAHIEIINQFHPLIKWVSNEIKNKTTNLKPAVAIEVKGDDLNNEYSQGVYLICINKWMFDGFRKIERMEFRGVKIDSGKRLKDNMPERMSTQAAIKGKYWQEVAAQSQSLDLSFFADRLSSEMELDYERFIKEEEAKNHDRLQIQESNLKENYKRKLQTLEEVRSKHLINGYKSMAILTEGKIKKLRDRTEVLLKQIEEKRICTKENESIAIALINIL